MTCVDTSFVPSQGPLIAGYARDTVTRTMERLTGSGRTQRVDSLERHASAQRTPLEENLRAIQEAISDFSMHLPRGFAQGLSRQFANMLDEEEWDKDDRHIDLGALGSFLVMLHRTGTTKRPGIGTNGRGSVAAFWRNGDNRLTANCLPSGEIAWVISRTNDTGERERAAGTCRPARLGNVLAPYNPGIWFDQ